MTGGAAAPRLVEDRAHYRQNSTPFGSIDYRVNSFSAGAAGIALSVADRAGPILQLEPRTMHAKPGRDDLARGMRHQADRQYCPGTSRQ